VLKKIGNFHEMIYTPQKGIERSAVALCEHTLGVSRKTDLRQEK
jgi:hypothetical protein